MDNIISKIVNLLINAQTYLNNAIDTMYDLSFDTTLLYQYFGYMRYAMGTPLYIMFSSVALIAIAVAFWNLIVKGINYLRGCM